MSASPRFTVDTHLFRELGELLVGRNSTALMELAKNAYDADARTVTIYGQSLEDTEKGYLIVTDDGIGMTPEVFNTGFLRIASRYKDTSQRCSRLFRRRFTGAKGIGRLSAHKLAREMTIHSIPDSIVYGSDARPIKGRISWELIEQAETLQDIGPNAVTLEVGKKLKGRTRGTSIRLTKLRRAWTRSELSNFFVEVESFQPPSVLLELPKQFPGQILHEPTYRETANDDAGFSIVLEGDLDAGEDYWQNVVQAASWLLEIDALTDSEEVRVAVIPMESNNRRKLVGARAHLFRRPLPNLENRPRFQARILIREGRVGTGAERLWSGKNSGIRVYQEGFRVLPYGQGSDDWLSIDADYKSRSRRLALLDGLPFAGDLATEDEGLSMLSNDSYFGAVFLTLRHSKGLEMLVNREGFVPTSSFDFVTETLRWAVALSVRVRAATTKAAALKKEQEGKASDEVRQPRKTPKEKLNAKVQQAQAHVEKAAAQIKSGDSEASQKSLERAVEAMKDVPKATDELIDSAAFFRVLASVGTQMSAFVHEVNSLLATAQALEKAVQRLRSSPDLSEKTRREVARLTGAIGELRRSIERQASFLTDVTSPDARRRRSRQEFRERFEASRNLVEQTAVRRGIQILNELEKGIKSPPMFPAELTLVFTNLLSNAIKAATPNGRILAKTVGSTRVQIHNTGVAVNLAEGERWFVPFESTTIESDPVLGQGMGMGLTLTRQMLDEYGVSIQFIRPSPGYTTAVEMDFTP